MKMFRCGDLVPGCAATFAGTAEEILAAVARHAHHDHGVAEVTRELADAVRGSLIAVR
jgi:predicted small metal-binding protein